MSPSPRPLLTLASARAREEDGWTALLWAAAGPPADGEDAARQGGPGSGVQLKRHPADVGCLAQTKNLEEKKQHINIFNNPSCAQLNLCLCQKEGSTGLFSLDNQIVIPKYHHISLIQMLVV